MYSGESSEVGLSELEDTEEEEEEDEDEEERVVGGGEALPYPGFIPIALKYLDQHSRPRTWCLFLITNPYPLITAEFKI